MPRAVSFTRPARNPRASAGYRPTPPPSQRPTSPRFERGPLAKRRHLHETDEKPTGQRPVPAVATTSQRPTTPAEDHLRKEGLGNPNAKRHSTFTERPAQLPASWRRKDHTRGLDASITVSLVNIEWDLVAIQLVRCTGANLARDQTIPRQLQEYAACLLRQPARVRYTHEQSAVGCIPASTKSSLHLPRNARSRTTGALWCRWRGRLLA